MAGWTGPPLPVRWGPGHHKAFVGRRRELRALQDSWSTAARGLRQVVFVGGEPGVGKSRLVADTAAHLHERGAAVLVGTCVPEMGAPYQPFVEPIGALIDEVIGGALATRDARAASEQDLESLRTIVGGRLTRSGDPAHQFTRQLFEACVTVMTRAAQVAPLVVVLEDLQWAGDTALQLLRYLVEHTAESRILFLATVRTSAPDRSAALVSTVGQLYRLDGVGRVDLEGLAVDEIADFLAAVAVGTQRNLLAAAAVLRDQTGGNPFLLLEVWRELAQHGGLAALREIDLQAPDSVRETVANRLDGLPTSHRRTVEIAAVIGEDVPVTLLSAIVQRQSTAPDAAALTYAGVEAATAVGLLEPVRGLDAVYRFPHGLARQAVLDLTTAYRRACDNACVAEVLEESFPAADRRVQRLAYHYASASALGYTAKAVTYLTAAGDTAERSLAHHEAARLFERAAAITADTVHRDELRMRAARSHMRSAHFTRARELDELVATTATGADRLRAAIGFEAASWRTGEPGDRAVELLTEARTGVTLDRLHPLRIRSTAALGRALVFSSELDRGEELADEAIADARLTGDDALIATAIQIGLQVPLPPDRLAETLRRAEELTELSARIGDPRHLGPAAHHRATICYIRGDPAGLAQAHRDLARTARATGQTFWEWVTCCFDIGAAYLRADFEAATQLIGRSEELAEGFGRQPLGPPGLGTFMIRRETGRWGRIRGLIDGSEDPTVHWAPGLLALYCEWEMRDPARRTLHHLLQHGIAAGRRSTTWPIVLSFLCDAAGWLEDTAAAEILLPLIKEYAGMNLLAGEFLAMAGSADRSIGELSSLLQEPAADDHFVDAWEMDTRMGSPVHAAWTLASHARHLRRIGQTSRALELSDRARVLSQQHGLSRVERMLGAGYRDEAAERPPGGGADLPAGLTARERQVLRLVVSGLSNRKIAQALHISENTAANHVRSILIKTGAANRTQAAMFASSHGLL